MGWESDLAVGLAQLLAGQGVGQWDPDAVLTDLDWPITEGAVPAECPRGIGIHTVPMANSDPVHPTGVAVIQFVIRDLTFPACRDVDNQIDALIDGLHGITFGTVTLGQAQALSATPITANSQGQWERSHQYRAELDLPATASRSY